jgi:hypothetical protein
MKATEALQTALKSTQSLLNVWLGDLDDADLLVRPVPGANHIAWQLGHLITAEIGIVKSVVPDALYPELPKGFAEQHGKETAAQEPAKGFLGKAGYLDLFNQVRQVTLETVGKLTDADLDKPTTGRLAQFAPTVGAMLVLVSNHTLMHGGQFTVVRRKLGKPVLI